MEKVAKNSELEEILEISRQFFPFGAAKIGISEDCRGEGIQFQRNLAIFLKKRKENPSIPLRTLLKMLDFREEAECFEDFNANYSCFMAFSLINSWQTQKSCSNFKENIYKICEIMKSSLKDIFEDNSKKKPEALLQKLSSFFSFKFDLLKDSHLEFLLRNLLVSCNLDLVFHEKNIDFLQKFVRNLFEAMIKSDFFENSLDFRDKLQFFFVKSRENSLKNSHFFEGFAVELSNFLEFSAKSLENLRVCVCVQEFFEKKELISQEIPLRKGFDERFFLCFDDNYQDIFSETIVNFIFFQRKIPQKLRNSLKSKKIAYLDAFGEKNIRNLTNFLEICPIFDVFDLKTAKNCEKTVKSLKKLEIEEFEGNTRLLIMRKPEGGSHFNVIFFINHEKLAKNVIISEIPKILRTLCAALNENEFFLEIGYADIAFFVGFVRNVENLVRNSQEKREIYGILQGFYCFLVFFEMVLASFNEKILRFIEEKLRFLHVFFENRGFYLYDYELFLKDCEMLRKVDYEAFFSQILRFCIENNENFCQENARKFKNIQEYIDILLEKDPQKLLKISKHVKLNLKQKKFQYFYSTLSVLQQFLFLNFI